MEHTLNPFAPPIQSQDQNADDSNVDGRRDSSKWLRLASWVVPAILGIGLALNVGNLDGRLGYLVMRSPVTITVTTFIRENFPPRLFDLEQDFLAHLPLTPYFLLYAIVLTFVLSPNVSPGLIMLPMAYAVVVAPQLLLSSGYFESSGLRWYHMIPSAMYIFCYIPITKVGIDVASLLRTASFTFVPRLLGLVSVFAILALCIAFIPSKSLHPLFLLIELCAVAYMTQKTIEAATNNPMDRSGGSAAS